MPRAHEYRAGASLLRQRSIAFAEAAATYRGIRIDDFAVGPIADVHAESMSGIVAHLAAGSDHLSHLAAVCDERAAVCEAYAARMREWERLPLWDRLLTPRPASPAPWAQA